MYTNLKIDIPTEESFKYFPDKQYYFHRLFIGIAMKPELDTRMEMIDFLHYLQYSGLTKPHFIKVPLPEDSVKVNSINPNKHKKMEPFTIDMRVYQQIKPGMNMPESLQGWSISSEIIEVMDFSDKEDILNNITKYGKLEGVNPSGMVFAFSHYCADGCVRIIELTSIYWLALFFIGPIISVARVERPGAWD